MTGNAHVLGEIVAAVAAREPVDGVRLVGVDGPSGAGKSHLARDLARVLAAPVVEIDDFLSWNHFDGWWPRFEAEVLTPLSAGRDAVYRVRDWTGDWYGDSLGGWTRLPWAPTVILDGVTCTRRAVADRLAYAVWVGAPREVRLARGLDRDREFAGAERLWHAWMAEEDRFFAADGTPARADLVVDHHP